MTELAMDGLVRELTSEELALVAGGSFWGTIEHYASDVGKAAKVVANGVVSHFAAQSAGEIAGEVLGEGAGGPVGAVVGAAVGTAAGDLLSKAGL